MLITEQKLKRLGRLFYRGSLYPDWDESLSLFKCFYVTSEPSYALYYATDEDTHNVGYVTEFYLNKPCNLFNANSDRDFQILKTHVTKNKGSLSLQDLRTLCTEDWLLLGSGKKEELIRCLKELNFDGFVNFERVRGFFIRRSFGGVRSFSGIGLFNLLEFFKQGKQYKGFSEVSKIPKVKADIESELAHIREFAEDKFDLVSSKKDLINLILLPGVNKYLVTLEDIENVVNSLDPKKLQERFKLESHRKSFRS